MQFLKVISFHSIISATFPDPPPMPNAASSPTLNPFLLVYIKCTIYFSFNLSFDSDFTCMQLTDYAHIQITDTRHINMYDTPLPKTRDTNTLRVCQSKRNACVELYFHQYLILFVLIYFHNIIHRHTYIYIYI